MELSLMKNMLACALAITFTLGGTAMAQRSTSSSALSALSAQASNPQALGWMQCFLPSDDKTIRFTDADDFAFPTLRWTLCNAASDPTSLPAYRAVANHLMAHDKTPLLGPEWVVEDIAGAGVIDRSHATLQFLRDGRIVGNATCNRFFGSYESTGPALLRIEPAGANRMACPPALMHQENKLLQLLPAIKSYRIDKTGALVLSTADGQTVLARRQ